MANRHAALSGGRLGKCGPTFGEPAVDQAEKSDDQGGLVIQVDVEFVVLTLSAHEKIFLGYRRESALAGEPVRMLG
ncbi:hypothetical protein [uncultured Brevundimonas sp.]|uniref:hypothetical protein n=1 Tax=uncultured Brevundimonas sp. TaxID=213418 RepID=UPI0025ECFC02|nr:hypothetical protein [uncultured Brevundimonas sp.]